MTDDIATVADLLAADAPDTHLPVEHDAAGRVLIRTGNHARTVHLGPPADCHRIGETRTYHEWPAANYHADAPVCQFCVNGPHKSGGGSKSLARRIRDGDVEVEL